MTFSNVFNITEMLYCLKKINKRKVVEVQRGDLVGQFLGSTEEKTTNKIEEAKGNALFVDNGGNGERESNDDFRWVANRN